MMTIYQGYNYKPTFSLPLYGVANAHTHWHVFPNWVHRGVWEGGRLKGGGLVVVVVYFDTTTVVVVFPTLRLMYTKVLPLTFSLSLSPEKPSGAPLHMPTYWARGEREGKGDTGIS